MTARTARRFARNKKKMKERGGGKMMMRKFVLLLVCVQNCASQYVPYTGKCAHDESAKALTHELLKGGYEAYKDIECVPAYLFCQTSTTGGLIYSDCATGRGYGSEEVEISGPLNSLLHVEDQAFRDFKGKITWSAVTPKLKEVGCASFSDASNPASTVTFGTPMTSLETIGRSAFASFDGEIAFNAPFPKLKEVGEWAFSASNPASTVVLDNAPLLETIGSAAFNSFKGNVQLVGEFPRLSSIGRKAFYRASNSASRVEIICRSDGGLAVGKNAFDDLQGTRVEDGEEIGCSDYTAPTTTSTVTTATTTATSSTISSTTTTPSHTLTSTTFTSTTNTATTVTDTATTTTRTNTTTTATTTTPPTSQLGNKPTGNAVGGGTGSSTKVDATNTQHSTTATNTQHSTTATTTTRLQVNDECDPLNDGCDKTKNLVCVLEDYKCRYRIEESTDEKKSNTGAIVGGALGGLVLLVVFGIVVYRCGQRKNHLKEVRARVRPPTARNQPDVHPAPYGETTYRNPAYDVASQEAPPNYAEIPEETTYEEADPKRPSLYDRGFLPGSKSHELRDKRLSQQVDEDDLDV